MSSNVIQHTMCPDDQVVMAQMPHPIPFRTRPGKSAAPMVLCLKARESRSLPGLLVTLFAYNGLVKTFLPAPALSVYQQGVAFLGAGFFGAGWSSPVARQAHNLKVVGSNPTPATNLTTCFSWINMRRCTVNTYHVFAGCADSVPTSATTPQRIRRV